MRRNSLEIVEGDRPSRRAISRTPTSPARSSAISSRSAKDRYRPESGPNPSVGMPPPSRNHREPTTPETPHAIPASSLEIPSTIRTQNSRSPPRRIGGLPGERIAGRPVNAVIQPAGRPMQHHLDQGVATIN